MAESRKPEKFIVDPAQEFRSIPLGQRRSDALEKAQPYADSPEVAAAIETLEAMPEFAFKHGMIDHLDSDKKAALLELERLVRDHEIANQFGIDLADEVEQGEFESRIDRLPDSLEALSQKSEMVREIEAAKDYLETAIATVDLKKNELPEWDKFRRSYNDVHKEIASLEEKLNEGGSDNRIEGVTKLESKYQHFLELARAVEIEIGKLVAKDPKKSMEVIFEAQEAENSGVAASLRREQRNERLDEYRNSVANKEQQESIDLEGIREEINTFIRDRSSKIYEVERWFSQVGPTAKEQIQNLEGMTVLERSARLLKDFEEGSVQNRKDLEDLKALAQDWDTVYQEVRPRVMKILMRAPDSMELNFEDEDESFQHAVGVIREAGTIEKWQTPTGNLSRQTLLKVIDALSELDTVARENKNITEQGRSAEQIDDVVNKLRDVLAPFVDQLSSRHAIHIGRGELKSIIKECKKAAEALDYRWYGQVGFGGVEGSSGENPFVEEYESQAAHLSGNAAEGNKQATESLETLGETIKELRHERTVLLESLRTQHLAYPGGTFNLLNQQIDAADGFLRHFRELESQLKKEEDREAGIIAVGEKIAEARKTLSSLSAELFPDKSRQLPTLRGSEDDPQRAPIMPGAKLKPIEADPATGPEANGSQGHEASSINQALQELLVQFAGKLGTGPARAALMRLLRTSQGSIEMDDGSQREARTLYQEIADILNSGTYDRLEAIPHATIRRILTGNEEEVVPPNPSAQTGYHSTETGGAISYEGFDDKAARAKIEASREKYFAEVRKAFEQKGLGRVWARVKEAFGGHYSEKTASDAASDAYDEYSHARADYALELGRRQKETEAERLNNFAEKFNSLSPEEQGEKLKRLLKTTYLKSLPPVATRTEEGVEPDLMQIAEATKRKEVGAKSDIDAYLEQKMQGVDALSQEAREQMYRVFIQEQLSQRIKGRVASRYYIKEQEAQNKLGQQVRAEAWSSEKSNFAGKIFNWYQNKDPKKRKVISAGLAAGTGAGIAVASAVAWPFVLAGAGIGVARWGAGTLAGTAAGVAVDKLAFGKGWQERVKADAQKQFTAAGDLVHKGDLDEARLAAMEEGLSQASLYEKKQEGRRKRWKLSASFVTALLTSRAAFDPIVSGITGGTGTGRFVMGGGSATGGEDIDVTPSEPRVNPHAWADEVAPSESSVPPEALVKLDEYPVVEGDNIWNILKNKVFADDVAQIRAQNAHLPPDQIDTLVNRYLDVYDDYLTGDTAGVPSATHAELVEMGIESGDANKIFPGQKLDFQPLIDEGLQAQARAEVGLITSDMPDATTAARGGPTVEAPETVATEAPEARIADELAGLHPQEKPAYVTEPAWEYTYDGRTIELTQQELHELQTEAYANADSVLKGHPAFKESGSFAYKLIDNEQTGVMRNLFELHQPNLFGTGFRQVDTMLDDADPIFSQQHADELYQAHDALREVGRWFGYSYEDMRALALDRTLFSKNASLRDVVNYMSQQAALETYARHHFATEVPVYDAS